MRFRPNHSHYLILLAGALLFGIGWYWYGHQTGNPPTADENVNASDASVLSAEDEGPDAVKNQANDSVSQAIRSVTEPDVAETQPAPEEQAPVEAPKPDYITDARLAEFIDGQAGPAASTFGTSSRLLLVMETTVTAGQAIESKITVEKITGARVGSEQVYELHDGEIVLANPGQVGRYAVVIKVGNTETRRIEFSIE